MPAVKIQVRDVHDDIDALNLADTVRSPGFGRIERKYAMQREQCIRQLIAAETWDQARLLQGEIRGIERSISVPRILKDEDTAKKKGKNNGQTEGTS